MPSCSPSTNSPTAESDSIPNSSRAIAPCVAGYGKGRSQAARHGSSCQLKRRYPLPQLMCMHVSCRPGASTRVHKKGWPRWGRGGDSGNGTRAWTSSQIQRRHGPRHARNGQSAVDASRGLPNPALALSATAGRAVASNACPVHACAMLPAFAWPLPFSPTPRFSTSSAH